MTNLFLIKTNRIGQLEGSLEGGMGVGDLPEKINLKCHSLLNRNFFLVFIIMNPP